MKKPTGKPVSPAGLSVGNDQRPSGLAHLFAVGVVSGLAGIATWLLYRLFSAGAEG